jgi:hypothetical protein
MKSLFILICLILFLSTGLSAQKKENVTVKAGTSALDYFPFQERYRFPEYRAGKVFFKNGTFAAPKLNYNYFLREMEYIQSKDTLAIKNGGDIKLIAIAGDTFYYDNGYLELIFGGQVKVALKHYISLKEVQKKDAYGIASTGAATDSYGSMLASGNAYKLISNQDRVFEDIREYYLSVSPGGFVPYTKKKVLQLYPQHKKTIEGYLKSNKVDFDSRDDLLRLAGYLQNL